MFCLRTLQIWSDLICDYKWPKCFSLIFIWIVFVRGFIRSESLQSIIKDRAVETSEGQFIGNDGVRI